MKWSFWHEQAAKKLNSDKAKARRMADALAGPEWTNKRWAERVGRVLEDAYTDLTDIPNAHRTVFMEQSWQGMVINVLSDLRHLCDREGIAFGELDDTAHRHYSKEMSDERDATARAGHAKLGGRKRRQPR